MQADKKSTTGTSTGNSADISSPEFLSTQVLTNPASANTNLANSRNSAPIPEIKTNIALASIEHLKKYAGMPYGMSMAALTLIDHLNRDLQMELTFESDMYVGAFATHIIGVWNQYTPIPCLIRSYKLDGEFLDTFQGEEMQTAANYPTSLGDFKNKKAIIDIEQTTGYATNNSPDKPAVGPSYLFKCYRWNEIIPRTLLLNIAPIQENKDF